MSKLSQRQVVAKVIAARSGGSKIDPSAPDWASPMRQYFAQVSGGEIQANIEKVYDGGARFPEVLPAPTEVGDLTVTRHYDPDIDGDPLIYYRDKVGTARFDVNVFTIDADGNQIGNTRSYANALLTNITEPEGDSSASAPATFALTFAIGQVTSVKVSGT